MPTWFWLLIALWITFEIWRFWCIIWSLRSNQLLQRKEYEDALLSSLEAIVNTSDASSIAVLLASMFPIRIPNTGQQPLLNTEDENFLRQSLQDLVASQRERPLTQEELLRVQRIAGALAKIKKEQQVAEHGEFVNLSRPSKLEEQQQSSNSSFIFHNTRSYIYLVWYPSVVDLVFYLYRRQFEVRLRLAGFQQDAEAQEKEGLQIWIRKSEDANKKDNLHERKQTPILLLHGISCCMTLVFPIVDTLRDRLLILPIHPSLQYRWRVDYRKGELPSTLQYSRQLTSYLQRNKWLQLDIIAWSFGGFIRNYLYVEWSRATSAKKPQMHRQILVEPMGLPIASAVAGAYNLLPIADAYRRARSLAPQGAWWYALMTLFYFRYHVHIRPMYTDLFWSSHSQGVVSTNASNQGTKRSTNSRREEKHENNVHSWNHPNVLMLLSTNDIVVPYETGITFLRRNLPKASFLTHTGDHGSWPDDPDFVVQVKTWLS
jgi:pimeloyl-ACP methyl ester carboxylesterase